MKAKIISLLLSMCITTVFAQDMAIDLTRKYSGNSIKAHNRTIKLSEEGNGAVEMDARPGDGLGLIKGLLFTKGIIEIDIKGENNPGKSFVGIAFNIQNDSTFEAVYFRPFNFVAEEQIRKDHMLQYIHHPEFIWRRLRESRTGEFENEIETPPNPDDWFRVRLEIEDDRVRAYVNGSDKASLEVERLTSHKSDQIGLWTGFNSAGKFRNLRISTFSTEEK